MNPLRRLAALRQSVWYDYIRRDLYQGPELRRLIEEDGLRGMTSNPTIFEKAIAETELYDEDIRRLAEKGNSPAAIFESLAV
jgi:transaldolase